MHIVREGQEQFTPISDELHFPLLTAGSALPHAHLMGCERLTFFSFEKSEAMPVILKEGTDWHLYAEAFWPSLSSWIEIDTSAAGFQGYSGVLVATHYIPEEESDPFDWSSRKGPLQRLFPEERSESAINQRIEALRKESESAERLLGPVDSTPRYVQSYCIYRGSSGVRLLSSYTDMLNKDGIVIPRYRMANVASEDIELCRFTLHALFRLNEARLSGMKFTATAQLDTFRPLPLPNGKKSPNWAMYYPLRVLRTRPAIRAIPTPTNLVDGVMHMETAEKIMEVRQLEAGLHLLAFDLDARPRYENDVGACMGAFSHRANGGAIYVLPDRLVEEFDNTDCQEIRMKDIRIPFPNLFLKFTPPEPLFLAGSAPVDGCYIVKQGEEYLLSLTSHWEGVDYGRSLSVTCIDPVFSIHLPAPEVKLGKPDKETELRVNEAVELGIQDFLETNAPPAENISQTITRPDGTTTYVEDIRAKSRKRRIEVFRSQEPVFRACLNIVVNAACFITFYPEDITEEWDGDLPAWVEEALNDNSDTRRARDRKQHALRTISGSDFTRIRICGKKLFPDVAPDPATIGHGVSPRAHWRRGHWRRQRYGTGLSLVVSRWIRPTIVKKENGLLVEARIYGFQEPPDDPLPPNPPERV